MRNLLEYPVTTEEIVQCLVRLKEKEEAEIEAKHIMGDMTPLLLEKAIMIVRASGQLHQALQWTKVKP